MSRVPSPNCVTIFGAGVTGLTAAHELVERGFHVQVWEPATDTRFPARGCEVGGMARTQWSRVHWPECKRLTDPWPRIEPMLYDLRHLGGRWCGLCPQITADPLSPDYPFVSDLDVFRELLAEIDEAGEAALVDVVVYRDPGVSDRDALDDVLAEFQALSGGGAPVDPFVVSRPGLPAVTFSFDVRKEKSWMFDVSGARYRLEFYYTPPWGTQTRPIAHLPQKFYIGRCKPAPPSTKVEPGPCGGCFQTMKAPKTQKAPKKKPLSVAECAQNYCVDALGKSGERKADPVADELLETLSNNPWIRHVYVEIADRRWARRTCECGAPVDPGWDTELAGCLLLYFQELLRKKATATTSTAELSRLAADPLCMTLRVGMLMNNGRLVNLELTRLTEFPEGVAPCVDVVMEFRVREHQLPGEHGYRFFPAFYHHLFDTMRRTPILDPVEKSPVGAAQELVAGIHPDRNKYTESFRVTHDNVKSQSFTALAFSRRTRPALMGRSWPRSATEVLEHLEVLLDEPQKGMGFTWNDWVRFNLKYLEYLTSCGARRTGYEECSWWDFVGGDTYSPTAQVALSRFPKALVAMDAVEGDARTIGSAGAQTFLDQFHADSFRDGTLRGPTSEAWLKYWRRYLEAQGVEFVHGKIKRLTVVDDGPERRVWPEVECYEPLFPMDDQDPAHPCLMTGYVILALPADVVRQIATDSLQDFLQSGIRHRDLERAQRLELGNPHDVHPDGELRHFAGIQFYFEEDVYWLQGHVYFPDSPWALTAVSQVRVWEDKHDWEHGYRGVLSVIIGKWDVPGSTVGRTAWDCTPEELAREVWAEISGALSRKRRENTLGGELPRPLFWHLDDSFSWNEDVGWQNATPFQIETPGRFRDRPGELGLGGYSTEHGLVLAGTFAKTYTRLTCMEAANESGRHAVNAVLRDLNSPFRRTPCDIWPIEEREIIDFDFLKSVDQELFERGLPHAMEIIGIDRLAQEFVEPLAHSPWDPLEFLKRVGQIVSEWKAGPSWPQWP